MKKNLLTIVVFSLFLAVFLSACNQTQFPTGSFTHRSYGDFTRDYVLEIHDESTWTYRINQEVASFGTYTIQDNEFNFETDDYCDADQTGPATYTWTFEDDVLYFEVKGVDKCNDRRVFMDHMRFEKQP